MIINGTWGPGGLRTSGDHPNTVFCERAEYWEESWRLEETCCHSNFSERPSAYAHVKNPQGINNYNDDDLWEKYFRFLKLLPVWAQWTWASGKGSSSCWCLNIFCLISNYQTGACLWAECVRDCRNDSLRLSSFSRIQTFPGPSW